MAGEVVDDDCNHDVDGTFAKTFETEIKAILDRPEEALRKANRKFEKRFRTIEVAPGFRDMTLDEMEALWAEAKRGG